MAQKAPLKTVDARGPLQLATTRDLVHLIVAARVKSKNRTDQHTLPQLLDYAVMSIQCARVCLKPSQQMAYLVNASQLLLAAMELATAKKSAGPEKVKGES